LIENLFINVLEISLTSTAAMAAILLISKFAENKFRKKWRYWIWIFLAIYLALPIKIDLPSAPIQVDLPPHEMIITQSEAPETGEIPPLSTEPEQENNFEHEETVVNPQEPVLSTDPVVEQTEQKTFVFPVVFVGAMIWIAGAVIVCGWNIAMYIRFSVRTKLWNRKINDEFVLNLFESLKKEMGIPEKVKIYENCLIKSPMMVGFAKPRVLLPSEALLPEEYEFVLRHELTHYKRGDIGYKFILMLAASVHWFNPAIGFMCRNAEKDIEITCDEAVVKAMEGDRRQEYCATILNIMRRGQNSPLLLSTSFYGGKKFLKSRFAAVLNPKTHRGVALFILAAIVILISGTMVACNEAEAKESIFGTEDEIAGGALEISEIIIKNRDNIEIGEYSEFFDESGFENIEGILSASREYLDYHKISYEDYEINTSINRILDKGERIVVEINAKLSYRYLRESAGVVLDDYREIKNELIKFTFDKNRGKFILAVIVDENGNPYTTARFRTGTEKDLEMSTLPEVTGPDKNGEFPAIDYDIYVKYINGRISSIEPEYPENTEIEPASESLSFRNRLREIYPTIRDWEVVYEESFYVLENDVYDPYTYSFRKAYVPYRFVILKTNQSNGFDTLFLYGYEDYIFRFWEETVIPSPYISGGWITAWESELGEIDYGKIVNPIGKNKATFWEPYEGKRLCIDYGGLMVFDLSIDIPEECELSYAFKLKHAIRSDNQRPKLSEEEKVDMILWLEGKYPGAYYYDLENKTLRILEGTDSGYFNPESGYSYTGFLDNDNFYISNQNTLYLYSLDSEDVTKCRGIIGGNGKGLSEGSIKYWDYYCFKVDGAKGGRAAMIYSNYDGEYWIFTFDFDGNILSNFSLGLPTSSNILSYTYHNGLVYFSYGGNSSEAEHYAVDTRPESKHTLQADAW